MVNVTISLEDRMRLLESRLVQTQVHADALNALLDRCCAVMTPEQLTQAGIAAPEPRSAAALQGAEIVEAAEAAAAVNGAAPRKKPALT